MPTMPVPRFTIHTRATDRWGGVRIRSVSLSASEIYVGRAVRVRNHKTGDLVEGWFVEFKQGRVRVVGRIVNTDQFPPITYGQQVSVRIQDCRYDGSGVNERSKPIFELVRADEKKAAPPPPPPPQAAPAAKPALPDSSQPEALLTRGRQLWKEFNQTNGGNREAISAWIAAATKALVDFKDEVRISGWTPISRQRYGYVFNDLNALVMKAIRKTENTEPDDPLAGIRASINSIPARPVPAPPPQIVVPPLQAATLEAAALEDSPPWPARRPAPRPAFEPDRVAGQALETTQARAIERTRKQVGFFMDTFPGDPPPTNNDYARQKFPFNMFCIRLAWIRDVVADRRKMDEYVAMPPEHDYIFHVYELLAWLKYLYFQTDGREALLKNVEGYPPYPEDRKRKLDEHLILIAIALEKGPELYYARLRRGFPF